MRIGERGHGQPMVASFVRTGRFVGGGGGMQYLFAVV